MKLNHDDVRKLLLAIENTDDIHGMSQQGVETFASDNSLSADQIAYMVEKLGEGNLITGKVYWASNVPYSVQPGNLTFQGIEYLDNIRSPKVWKDSKTIASKVGSVSLELMSKIASNVIEKSLGLN